MINRVLSLSGWVVAIAIVFTAVAHSSMTMSERAQIAKIKNMEAKFHCLAKHSVPMYEHVKTVNVPLSHFEVVTDQAGGLLPEGTPGSKDLQFLVHNYTQRRGGTGFLVGYLVDNGCFLLPPPPSR